MVLLEQHELTAGTTWHAAGLVPQLRATRNLCELARYSGDLYERLEEETGQATGFVRCGSIAVARTQDRLTELERAASMARGLGIEVHRLDPREIAAHWPLLRIDDLKGGIFLPRDGQTNPVDTTMALARGARALGVRIFEDCRVENLIVEGGHARGVRTSMGEVRAEKVVVCAGMWTADLLRKSGGNVPLHPAEHFYLVTEPLEGIERGLPVLRDPDGFAYYRHEVGDRLLVGFFEPCAKPWAADGVPQDFRFGQLRADFKHLEPQLEAMVHRLPQLEQAGIELLFNGPESFTPDDNAMLGELPNLRDGYVAAGFNSIGIQSAGGVGRVLADWVVDGEAPMDLWELDVTRSQAFQCSRRYLHDRTTETLGLLYATHWPDRQKETARGIRRSPFHHLTEAAGARFGEVAGWERPNWYRGSQASVPQTETDRYSWNGRHWLPDSGAEHRATRENVTLFDQSSFSKILVQGRDAETLMNWVCANNLRVEPGRVVYTQWLNARAGIEADVTVTRVGEDQYLVVGYAANLHRDLFWLKRAAARFERVVLTDVTPAWGVLGVMGPKSRELLETLTPADLSNEGFPFATSREIEVGYAQVRATRITYVGELGWELYIPADLCAYVYEQLVSAGDRFGLRHAGYYAISSLRLEKGYREWGHDIGPDDTPVQAGLGFAVDWHKENFSGRDALLAARDRDHDRRLVLISLIDDEAPLMIHEEPIYQGGEVVGRVTSGAYGHTVGASLAMGWLDWTAVGSARHLRSARFEVEVAGRRLPARASLRPLWDPRSERVRDV